jgi:hypothetical protein
VIPIVAPRFDLTKCNNERERGFIESLHARAEAGDWYADWWPRNDRLMLSVSRVDGVHNLVLRTLRIDFAGDAVRFGPDETHQFATDLDSTRPGVFAISGLPVAELATTAADWLEREMRRPIVRYEWHRPGFWRREWLLADTGEGLVVSDSANVIKRPGLGIPDKIVTVAG